MTLRAFIQLLCACVAFAAAVPTLAATTPRDLVEQGSLSIDSSVSPADGIVPGQKVRITLEVATDTWFTGGTRISVPEVPGLVLLQTEQFAANASESRGGRSWVIQRWTLDGYPQRAGTFDLPPITLSVSVNGGSAGTVSGEVRAPALSFDVTLPAALAELESWVAAPAFSAGQTLDRDADALAVGDAITRDITLEGTDLLPMMLPAIDTNAPDGLAAYPDPPVLDSSTNRGQSRASRRQSITYVAEQPGRYTLPGLEFFWWNTARDELQVVSLPALELMVTGSAAQATPSSPLDTRRIALAGSALVVLGLFAWLARRLLPRLPWDAMAGAARTVRERFAALRRPALPDRLNPGGSAGE